jgi:potassium voltage-gated channel KQT-like subfamily protein
MPEYEKIATIVLLPSVKKQNFFLRFVFFIFLKEILVFIWLSIELTLRVWSAGCRSRYQTAMGRLRFLKKPFCALGL